MQKPPYSTVLGIHYIHTLHSTTKIGGRFAIATIEYSTRSALHSTTKLGRRCSKHYTVQQLIYITQYNKDRRRMQ